MADKNKKGADKKGSGSSDKKELLDQIEMFDGDLPLALAAYNAGPGNVLRFAGIPPFRETRKYVRRVLGHYVGHLRSAWRDTGDLDWLVVEG